MAKKKSEPKPKKVSGVEREKVALALRKSKMDKDALSRLPSARSKLKCLGCFAPRNTLTVKFHVSLTWEKHEISFPENKSGVNLPCKTCKETRFLNLSKFSLDVFKVDLEQYGTFQLLKDDKYNALIGYGNKTNVLDLSEVMK